jgi:hypothetical protein
MPVMVYVFQVSSTVPGSESLKTSARSLTFGRARNAVKTLPSARFIGATVMTTSAPAAAREQSTELPTLPRTSSEESVISTMSPSTEEMPRTSTGTTDAA